MLIITRPTNIVRGKTNDAKYHVVAVSETVLIPESEEDRDIIEDFVAAHVPTIEGEHDEEYAPGLPELED